MKNIISNIRKVLAVEMLEREDKNYLAYDTKRNSEEKIKLLQEALKELVEFIYECKSFL